MKDKTCKFRISEKELEQIKGKAKSAGMNVSQYITACALEKEIVVIHEFVKFRWELRKIGVNLNQITALCHAGKIKCPDLAPVQKQLHGLWLEIKAFREQCSNGSH